MDRFPEFWDRARAHFRRMNRRAKTDRLFDRLVVEARSTGDTEALRLKGASMMGGHFMAPLWISVAVDHLLDAERSGMDSDKAAFIDRALLRAGTIIGTIEVSRRRNTHKLDSAHQRTRELRDSIEEDMSQFILGGGTDIDTFFTAYPAYSAQFSNEATAEWFHVLRWDLRKC